MGYEIQKRSLVFVVSLKKNRPEMEGKPKSARKSSTAVEHTAQECNSSTVHFDIM